MIKLKRIRDLAVHYAMPLFALTAYLFVATALVADAIINKKIVGLAVFTSILALAGLLLLYKMFATAFRNNHPK